MMRDEVAPELRRLGFKGSGSNYTLPNPDLHLLMNVQAVEGLQPGSLRVTVNIAMIDKAEYEEKRHSYFPQVPTAASILPVGRYFRIGALMGHVDQWWEVGPDMPTSLIARPLVQAIGDLVVPELLRGRMVGPSLNREEYDNSRRGST